MVALPAAVLDHFEDHHGIASRSRLLELGLTDEAIKRLRSLGLIEPVLQGADRWRGQPLTELGRCAAVCAAHPGHVISGPTAGRLWGFRRLPPDRRIHVLAPPAANPTRAGWVVPYRTAAIDLDRDVVERPDGILVTSRARTTLDLARWLGDLDLLSVIEQAMHDGSHTVEEMRAVAVDWRSPRRRWLERYLSALRRVLPGRPAESHDEVRLGAALAAAGLTGLERQYLVDLPGYGIARFDLAVPDRRWAIEVDGFPTHRETAGRRQDRRRDRAAQRAGWTVTRLGPEQLGEALDATVAALIEGAPAPNPSDER